MLEMTGISKTYRTEVVQTRALDGLDMRVDHGEFVAVTGPSGSGKTTFLNIAGLLETFDSGTYKLEGIDISNLNDNARSPIRNEKIGFIFQFFNLIPTLSVLENVTLPLELTGVSPALAKERSMPLLGAYQPSPNRAALRNDGVIG